MRWTTPPVLDISNAPHTLWPRLFRNDNQSPYGNNVAGDTEQEANPEKTEFTELAWIKLLKNKKLR